MTFPGWKGLSPETTDFPRKREEPIWTAQVRLGYIWESAWTAQVWLGYIWEPIWTARQVFSYTWEPIWTDFLRKRLRKGRSPETTDFPRKREETIWTAQVWFGYIWESIWIAQDQGLSFRLHLGARIRAFAKWPMSSPTRRFVIWSNSDSQVKK